MYSSYLELLLKRDGISIDGMKDLWTNSNSWSNSVHRNLNVYLFYSLFYSVTRAADKREVIMFLNHQPVLRWMKRTTGVKCAALWVTRHRIKVYIITVQFNAISKSKTSVYLVALRTSKNIQSIVLRIMDFGLVWDEWIKMLELCSWKWRLEKLSNRGSLVCNETNCK